MLCCAKFRLLVISVIAFYSVYLFSYKCHHKTLLEQMMHPAGGHHLRHPFSAQQAQVCNVVNIGSDFASPYVAKATDFLDQHVHSHALFKKYQMDSKIAQVKFQYRKHVYPRVRKTMQYFEIAEYRAAVYLHNLIVLAKKQFQSVVVPKAHDAKDAAASYAADAADVASSQAEVAQSAASSHLENAKDAAATHYETAKDVAASQYENAKDSAGTHYENVKDVAGDQYENAKDAAGDYYQQVVDAAGEQADNAKGAVESLEEQFKTQLEAAKDQVKSKFE